ncbi:hypothetical protein OESDEN_15724 [Oesophagostomum dentatum]|uniref:Malic enzyme NAD-binding domain-containing protein n=1 Tax=Oesophagostomum dentatum TaxID=61180 RepID=A0A0B1SMX8_OESDE|nr:hypothetical protein OESDEN_15724 [Oesophagostomum dentatum]
MLMHMKSEGANEEQAYSMIYIMMESPGNEETSGAYDSSHVKFVKDMPEIKNLYEIVTTVQPNGIIGVSAQGGAFTPEIMKEMCKIKEQSIIFALSNPAVKAEGTAK